MNQARKDARNIEVFLTLVFLFVFAFWQSYSGVFMYAVGFILGGTFMVSSNKIKGE